MLSSRTRRLPHLGTGAEEQVYVSGLALADLVVLTAECLHPLTVCESFLR